MRELNFTDSQQGWDHAASTLYFTPHLIPYLTLAFVLLDMTNELRIIKQLFDSRESLQPTASLNSGPLIVSFLYIPPINFSNEFVRS